MSILGNIVWFIFGGFMIAIEYFLGGIVMMLTIIGIPFGIQSMKMAELALFPFGRKVEEKPGAGGCALILSVLWIIVAGIPILVTHIFWGVLLSITIIGIPFGKQHFKLAKLALAPFNFRVV